MRSPSGLVIPLPWGYLDTFVSSDDKNPDEVSLCRWLGHPNSGWVVSSLPVRMTAVPSRTSASGLFVGQM